MSAPQEKSRIILIGLLPTSFPFLFVLWDVLGKSCIFEYNYGLKLRET